LPVHPQQTFNRGFPNEPLTRKEATGPFLNEPQDAAEGGRGGKRQSYQLGLTTALGTTMG